MIGRSPTIINGEKTQTIALVSKEDLLYLRALGVNTSKLIREAFTRYIAEHEQEVVISYFRDLRYELDYP